MDIVLEGRCLAIDEQSLVRVSPQLQYECNQWCLYIDGMSREAAVAYLRRETKRMKSDGVDCQYYGSTSWDEEWISPPVHAEAGEWRKDPCMCARLLMMLHDIREDEATRPMFKRLQAFLRLLDMWRKHSVD